MTLRDIKRLHYAQEDIASRTRKLTNHLHRGGQWVHFQDGGENDGYRKSHWIPVGKPFVAPSWWEKSNQFFTVNPGNVNRGANHATHNDDIVAVNTLYAEYDGKDFVTQEEWLVNYVTPDLQGMSSAMARGALQKAQTNAVDLTYKQNPELYKERAYAHLCAVEPRPSVAWASGGGYQALWLLRDTVAVDANNRAMVAHVQREWVHRVGGDPGAHDLRRILRFPGSKNFKPKYAPNYPTVTYEWFEFDRQYDFSDLAAMVPPIEARTHTARRTVHVPAGADLALGSCGDVPDLPRDNGTINAYNEATSLNDLLLDIGYTDHRKGRMSRPGGDSGGVEIMPNNTARIYSSADPLFCDGKHRITPAHALCVYGFNGDVPAMLAAIEEQSPTASNIHKKLGAARQWARSPRCIARLRNFGVQRVASLIPTLDTVTEIAIAKRTVRIVTSVRDIADRCGSSAATVYRHLARFVDAGLMTTQSDPYGTLIDLTLLLDLSETGIPSETTVSVGSTSQEDFFGEHRGDDAFTTYPYSYAQKRRAIPIVLLPSLSASGLLLWEALREGGTVNELAEATGLTVASVRATLKRFTQTGLVLIWQEGRTKEYLLHPNAWDLLDDKREHMVTAGIGQLRAAKNASDKASYAQRKLQGRMPLEPRQKAKLEVRRDKADEKAAAHYDALFGMGIDPHAKVRHRPPRPRLKIDLAEEWTSLYRPLFEQWEELAPLSFAERYRLLAFAGFERDEIDKARRRAGEFNSIPRQFVGVGEPSQEMAA